MREWLRLASDRSVVRGALGVSAVVGTSLVVLNHGAALARGELTGARIFQIILTMLVPYCVSTYSSVGTIIAARKREVRAQR